MNITLSPITNKAEFIEGLSDTFGRVEEIYATESEINAILFEEGLYYPEDADIEGIYNHILKKKNDFEWHEEAIDEEAEGGVYFRVLKQSEINNSLDNLLVCYNLGFVVA